MDKIVIENLRVFAYHGVMPEERTLGQAFFVSAVIYTDTHNAGISDKLEDSINYAEVCNVIERCMTEKTFSLIEAAAEHIARTLLTSYALAQEVEITLKKPSAPIPKMFECVSVCVHRRWHTAYLSIGSNMGDKQGFLNTAVTSVFNHPLCRDVKVSDYIVTKPVGVVNQDDFLNGVIELKTLMTPHELLDFAHKTEKAAGRVRTIRWGPRTLDVDILLYDDITMHDSTLIIPHPEMHKRAFVLEPLCSLNPYAVYPPLNKTARVLLDELNLSKKD